MAIVGKRDVAAAALEQIPALHRDFHAKILVALDGVGLLDKPSTQSVHAVGGSMSAAAAESRKASLRVAQGELHRLGIDLKDGLTIHQINGAMAAKQVAPETRIRIKSVFWPRPA